MGLLWEEEQGDGVEGGARVGGSRRRHPTPLREKSLTLAVFRTDQREQDFAAGGGGDEAKEAEEAAEDVAPPPIDPLPIATALVTNARTEALAAARTLLAEHGVAIAELPAALGAALGE